MAGNWLFRENDLARAVMTNPVGTELAPNVPQMGMPRGGFDPVIDPSLARWPGRPMTQSEYDAIRTGSLDLFGQAAMMAGSPVAAEAAGVAAMGRRPVPMKPAPEVPPTGAGPPEVWAPQPYGVAPVYRRANGPNEHTWAIKDYRGARAGAIDTTWNPATGNLHIDNIDAEGGVKNTLGIAAIRQLRSALLDQYPDVKTLTGLRISGATYADRGGGVGPGRNAIQYVQLGRGQQ